MWSPIHIIAHNSKVSFPQTNKFLCTLLPARHEENVSPGCTDAAPQYIQFNRIGGEIGIFASGSEDISRWFLEGE